MKRLRMTLAAGVMCAAPLALQAQGLGDAAAATFPQYATMKIGSGASAKTVSQLSVPMVLVLPFGSQFNIDIATSYATSELKVNGGTPGTSIVVESRLRNDRSEMSTKPASVALTPSIKRWVRVSPA